MIQNIKLSHAISDFISVGELSDLAVLVVRHPKATAVVSLFGGHVLSFQPTHAHDLLWLSQNADLSGTTAIRGGIPVCWPWFGKAELPSHGFARTAHWTLKEHRENEDGVIIHLELTSDTATKAIWNYDFRLTLQVEISDSLKVTLITENTGDQAFNYGGALHSYLSTSDIRQTEVSKLGTHFISAGQNFDGNDTVTFNQEIDRIYTQPSPIVTVHDQHTGHEACVGNAGHNAVVVWNPWQALSESMGDMANDSYQTMVCVESCIYDRSVEVAPKQSHQFSTKIYLKA